MSIVKNVIDEWDPIELLSFAPKDEYSIEIDMIEAALKSCDEENVLGERIFNIFTRTFDMSFSKSLEECKVIAHKILASNK